MNQAFDLRIRNEGPPRDTDKFDFVLPGEPVEECALDPEPIAGLIDGISAAAALCGSAHGRPPGFLAGHRKPRPLRGSFKSRGKIKRNLANLGVKSNEIWKFNYLPSDRVPTPSNIVQPS
jgi:hypothetical protein